MRTGRTLFVFIAVGSAMTTSGCSQKPKPAENTAMFLTLNHTSLAGPFAKKTDAELLRIGHRACADMDKGMRSDDVVAEIGGSPEPGSAAFNGYAFVAATAARALCPKHQDVFTGVPIP